MDAILLILQNNTLMLCGAFLRVTFNKSSTVMLGLLNNGVEHFLVGVLFLLFLLLLGVVGCIIDIGDCKETEERSGGGGGGIDDTDSELCAFGGNEKGSCADTGGGGGGDENTKDVSGRGGGGGGDEREDEDKGIGCEDFSRISSSISRNFFNSCSNTILSSVIFLLASRKTFISAVKMLRVASVFVRIYDRSRRYNINIHIFKRTSIYKYSFITHLHFQRFAKNKI